MAEHDALPTRVTRCWCGQPLVAVDNPATGALVLSHGTDAHPLVLTDAPLLARVLARDPAVLDEPPIRAWLRGYHPEP
jgi:hypothetical protein